MNLELAIEHHGNGKCLQATAPAPPSRSCQDPCSVNLAHHTRLHPPLFKEVLQLLPPKARDTRYVRSRTWGKQPLTNNKFRLYLLFDNERLDMRATF